MLEIDIMGTSGNFDGAVRDREYPVPSRPYLVPDCLARKALNAIYCRTEGTWPWGQSCGDTTGFLE
jgi:hypothetical protein